MTHLRTFFYTGIIGFLGFIVSGCDAANNHEEKQAAPVTKADPYSHMKMRKIESAHEYVYDDIKSAITDRGIKINNISHIGNMLKRTAEAVGATQVVYERAEAIEFCSSTVSRKTMEADIHNIVFCPYIISVYSLPGEKETTYVSYRIPTPVGTPESQESIKAVQVLLEEIITSAVE